MKEDLLVEHIMRFKQRMANGDNMDMLQSILNQVGGNSKPRAIKLIEEAIRVYKQEGDYSNAIKLIDESLKIHSTYSGYFNRGVIHWCEKNYYECFKDQCAVVLFNTPDFPTKYFYIAHSLLETAKHAERTNKTDSQIIVDFIMEILDEGAALGEENAINMRDDLLERMNN